MIDPEVKKKVYLIVFEIKNAIEQELIINQEYTGDFGYSIKYDRHFAEIVLSIFFQDNQGADKYIARRFTPFQMIQSINKERYIKHSRNALVLAIAREIENQPTPGMEYFKN